MTDTVRSGEGRPPADIPPATNLIRALGGIGVFCSLLIVLVWQFTLPVIEQNQREALEKAVFRVLPGAVQQKTWMIHEGKIRAVTDKPDPAGVPVRAGFDEEGRLVGLALTTAGQGFADVIRIIYGYEPEGQKIIGMQVLESKETPGLGDKIEKDPRFIANFRQLDVQVNPGDGALAHRIQLGKSGKKQNPWEIDSITGATISSRAIAKMLDASVARSVPLLAKEKAVFQLKREL